MSHPSRRNWKRRGGHREGGGRQGWMLGGGLLPSSAPWAPLAQSLPEAKQPGLSSPTMRNVESDVEVLHFSAHNKVSGSCSDRPACGVRVYVFGLEPGRLQPGKESQQRRSVCVSAFHQNLELIFQKRRVTWSFGPSGFSTWP